MSIVVQPPPIASTWTVLYPPTVACVYVSAEDTNCDYFAQAMLLDGGGSVLVGQLGGTPSVYGVAMQTSGGGGGSSSASLVGIYFAFSDLTIPHPGDYSIRIDIHVFSGGTSCIGSAETRPIQVVEEQCAVNRPSQTERRVMRALGLR